MSSEVFILPAERLESGVLGAMMRAMMVARVMDAMMGVMGRLGGTGILRLSGNRSDRCGGHDQKGDSGKQKLHRTTPQVSLHVTAPHRSA